MILWFGKKKKQDEARAAGAAMVAPELSADEIAAREAETATKQAEKAEIERVVAEANKAWEERQVREAAEADAEARRLDDEARRAETARAEALSRADEAEARRLEAEAEAARLAREEREAARAKAAGELKLLEDRREAARLREEREVAARAALEAEANDPGFVARLGSGLARSSSRLGTGLSAFNKRRLDDETLEDLEDLLITSDLGAAVAQRVTRNLSKERFDREITENEIKLALAAEIESVLAPREQIVDFSDGPRPRVVLFVGVNGSGKTTTIGKIASKLKDQGAKALLVAGDTFRAAAIEQLTVWGDRAGIPVMSKPTGADAAGLVYEAIERAKREDLDLVLVDTAGRLQNRAELMAELEKVVRVARKLDPDAPHDVILVLDATVGQNALSQVEAFRHTAGVTGLVMTKLDGTAKGGVLVAIAEAHDLPIHFIGVGEGADDLRPFSAHAFSQALVGAID
ncbi:signal recognition particle-docking protein FtsY [Hyphomonas sp.]|uniref:signal recognition particle-docking protein FtsY n=1 Tax=Hyphomonas sp. TaxID=87 RepID=UPI0032EDC247